MNHGVVVGLIAIAVLGPCAQAHSQEDPTDPLYTEFLWQEMPRELGARQEARGLLMNPDRPHQVCWRYAQLPAHPVMISITAFDAAGKQAWQREVPADGSVENQKTCEDFKIGMSDATPGNWTFRFSVDGQSFGERTIEVAKDLGSAHFYSDPDKPYTRGRVNYPSRIPEREWKGHFLWRIAIGPDGTVTNAENIEVVGAAKQLAQAGLAAARMTLAPPDPSRASKPMVFERRYELMPGE